MSHIAPIVIHETPSIVSCWGFLVEFQKKYFMGNVIRDITETNPVIPQVKYGYPLNYATGLKELYLNLKRGRRTTSPLANCSKPNWCVTASKPSFKNEL